MSEAQSDISELFARDPLSLTKEDITQVIAYFRENRSKFLNANVRATAPKEAKPKKGSLPLPDIDISDLEL